MSAEPSRTESRLLQRLALLWTVLLIASCNAPSRADVIDDYLYGLEALAVEEPTLRSGDPSDPAADGDFSCTVTNYSETRLYDRIVAFAANSDSMWPGAVLAGDSIYSGLFTQVPLDRKTMAVSISLESLDGLKSRLLKRPSLSSFRDAMTDILRAEVVGATPANIYAEIDQVHSEEQLALALGASAKWPGSFSSISASFNFSRENTRSRFLVKYTQAYYTVDVDPPSRPAGWWTDDVSIGDIKTRFSDGNPPVYVSSVTYGRMIVFTFESDYSAQEMGAALEFAYRGGVDVSGDVSVSYKKILSSSNITAYVLGGSGEEAARSIDSFESLMDFIRSGGNYSKESPGAPIAYKLNYLATNEPARLSFTKDYDVKECARVSQKVKVSLDWIRVEKTGGDGPELEIFGKIVAKGNRDVTLFDRGEAEAVVIAQGESWPRQGVLVEEVLDVTPQAGQVIYLRGDLRDSDSGWFSSDPSIGNEGIPIPFETGWRREVVLHLTGAGAQVDIGFTLTPI